MNLCFGIKIINNCRFDCIPVAFYKKKGKQQSKHETETFSNKTTIKEAFKKSYFKCDRSKCFFESYSLNLSFVK